MWTLNTCAGMACTLSCRGPILLCVDTSGSMRGARETVAKALALECMRAAKEQERDCYVFAFAGPAEVR